MRTTREEELIISSEAQVVLQHFVNGVEGFAAVIDRACRWIAFNEAYASEHRLLFGSTPEIGACMKDKLRDSDERQRVLNVWERALCGEKFVEIMEYGEADLERKSFRLTFGPLINEEGETYACFMVAQEIPGLSKLEISLRNEQERFDRLFCYAPIGLTLVSPKGKFLRVNRALCNIWGYSPQQLSGMSFNELTHPDDMKRGDELMNQLVSGELNDFELEKRYIASDGRIIWAQVTVSKMPDSSGQPLFFIAQVKDISDIKRNEKLLIEARDRALSADMAKSNFLAVMSHEIRTPMNAVLGFAQILELSSLDNDQKNWLQHIRMAGQHLLELIDGILNYSRIESGEIELDHSVIVLDRFIEEIFSMLRTRAHEKDLELSWSINESVPLTIVSDSGRLRQVLINLLGNAIKFTKKGRIQLKVESGSDKQGIAKISFSVIDTGVGIPSEATGKIFSPFVQADGTTSREYGGTGLGLAISARLAQSMGGTLNVKSEQGKGSTFTLVLPLIQSTASAGKRKNHEEGDLLGLHALLVGNLLDDQESLSTNLIQLGIHTKTAISVEKAWRELLAGHPFDIVLIDMDMPGESAEVFLKEYREEMHGNGPGLVALVPGNCNPSKTDLDFLKKIPVLEKPVTISGLRNTLASMLMGKKEKDEDVMDSYGAFSVNFASRHPCSIVVAEDKPSNKFLFSLFLEQLGYKDIRFYDDGESCVNAFRSNPADVIIMDIHLPGMDGVEAAKEIFAIEKSNGVKNCRSGKGVGIIAVSASVLQVEQERCRKAGIHAFLSKPLRLSLFRRTLAELIEEPE